MSLPAQNATPKVPLHVDRARKLALIEERIAAQMEITEALDALPVEDREHPLSRAVDLVEGWRDLCEILNHARSLDIYLGEEGAVRAAITTSGRDGRDVVVGDVEVWILVDYSYYVVNVKRSVGTLGSDPLPPGSAVDMWPPFRSVKGMASSFHPLRASYNFWTEGHPAKKALGYGRVLGGVLFATVEDLERMRSAEDFVQKEYSRIERLVLNEVRVRDETLRVRASMRTP